jgi:hypothetical protein
MDTLKARHGNTAAGFGFLAFQFFLCDCPGGRFEIVDIGRTSGVLFETTNSYICDMKLDDLLYFELNNLLRIPALERYRRSHFTGYAEKAFW